MTPKQPAAHRSAIRRTPVLSPSAPAPGTAPDPASPPSRPSQRARYDRVVEAALRLARRGGYEAVQMRDVVTESGVALGTIYKYFHSRDQLLFVAITEWFRDQLIEEQVPDEGPIGRQLLARVAWQLDLMGAQPRMLEAFVRSTTSVDPGVIALYRSTDFEGYVALSPTRRRLDAVHAERVTRVLSQVWYAAVVRWAYGQQDFDEVYRDLERTVRLAFPDDFSDRGLTY